MLAAAALVAYVGTVDTERSHAFYGGVLGLERISGNAFSNLYRVGDGELRVTRVPEVVVAGYTVAGFAVDDLESTVDGLAAAGVEIQRHDGFDQDERGIWVAPSGVRFVWFDDPDGNNLAVQQNAAG
jgi:catechol 2,3-dioxygenase-like lactoylglutathione lyase family enzyme